MSGFGDKLRGKMKNFADMGIKGHKNVAKCKMLLGRTAPSAKIALHALRSSMSAKGTM